MSNKNNKLKLIEKNKKNTNNTDIHESYDSNSIIYKYNSLLMQMDNKNIKISNLEQEKRKLEIHLNSVLNSKTYKIARLSSSLIKFPIRLFRKNNRSLASENFLFEENGDAYRISVQALYEKVKNYDYVSFDIFDTLIFRNVVNPTDVFMQIELNEE